MITGYGDAIKLAREKLKTLDIQKVSETLGVVFQDGEVLIPWFLENRPIESGSEIEQVLWLHYLTFGGGVPLTGRLIAFRELPSAMFYESKFTQRAEAPLKKRFGDSVDEFIKAGLALGGESVDHGDGAIKLFLLPRIPVTYILWCGDGELPPECRILLDSSASRYLPTEDLTVLASLGAYKLIKS